MYVEEMAAKMMEILLVTLANDLNARECYLSLILIFYR